MRVIEYKYPERISLSDTAVALGFFDGVHLAHRAIISDTVRIAKSMGLTPTVFTFPSECEGLKSGEARIYPTEERLSLFSELGVECVVLCDFLSVSHLAPEAFVALLTEGIGCRAALSGEDFRFGKDALGTSELLAREMRLRGGDAHVRKTMEIDVEGEGRVKISATAIRKYLAEGRVDAAAAMLGAPYRISSEVLHGRGEGRSLGFPTVNTELSGAPVGRGVYRTRVTVGNECYDALTNVGTCPTFGERTLHAETHIPDFSGSLYGEKIRIEFISFIREERAFSSREEFLREVERNVKSIREKI